MAEIPMMMQFLFGEAAEAAQRGASRRLKRWATAFDGWLNAQPGTMKQGSHKTAVLAWRRLLKQQHRMPWEMRTEDVREHARWMEEEGYAAPTINNALGLIESFYRWCGEQRVDAACGKEFNPARGVTRIKTERYAGQAMLSRGEVRGLLETLRADRSPLGRREYAFFLLRLSTGAPLSSLQGLKWGGIDVRSKNGIERSENSSIERLNSPCANEVWVSWRAEAVPQQLPEEVWEAILDYLAASGRLDEIQEDDYIFTPLREPFRDEGRERAEAWDEGRHLSSREILENLKLYGRLAGIAEEKLTLMALRRTATRLRLDEGASVEEMQEFLDSREGVRSARYRLKRLPELPEDEEGEGAGVREIQTPVRTGSPFKPGEGMTHGFYAQNQPPEEVRAVMRENIRGIKEEITGLRWLGQEQLARQARAESEAEAIVLGQAYTLTAARLAGMMAANKEIEPKKKSEKDRWVDRMLRMIDRIAVEEGEEPWGEALRAAVLNGGFGWEEGEPHLGEEIAATRYTLRRTISLAMETGETKEFNKLTEIYSMGCNRLLKLLRVQGPGVDRLFKLLDDTMEAAFDEARKDLGFYNDPEEDEDLEQDLEGGEEEGDLTRR